MSSNPQVDTKIYQFIARNGGLEKVDANGNGSITLSELTNFLEGCDLSQFGNKEDLISDFFKTFDTNIRTGKITGTNDRNCGALDKDEQKALEAKIQKYGDFESYLTNTVYKKFPEFLGNGTKAAWQTAVATKLQALFNNFTGNDFATLKSQWEKDGTINKIVNQATADFYKSALSNGTILNLNTLNLSNDEKKKIQAELESFLNQFTSKVDANTKVDDIQAEMEKIVNTYLAKAGIKGYTTDDEIAEKYGIASKDDQALNELQKLVIAKNYSSVLTKFLNSDENYKKYISLGGDASLINATSFFNEYCKGLKNKDFAGITEAALKEKFKGSNEYAKIQKGIDAYEQSPAKIKTAIEADDVLKMAGYEKLKDTATYTTAFKSAVAGYIQGSVASIDAIAQKVVEALKGNTAGLANEGLFGGTDVGEFPTVSEINDVYNTNVTIANGNLEQTIGAAKKYIQALLDKKYTPYNNAISAVFKCNADMTSVNNALYKMKSADEVTAAMNQLIEKLKYADYDRQMKTANGAKDTYNNAIQAAGTDNDKKVKAALTYIQTLISTDFAPFIEIIRDVFGTLKVSRSVLGGKSIEKMLKKDPSLIDTLMTRIEQVGPFIEVPKPTVTLQTTYTAIQGQATALDYNVEYANKEAKHTVTFESSNPDVLVDANGKITVWDASSPTVTTEITIYVDGKVLKTQTVTINVISTEQVEAYKKAPSTTYNIKADALAYGQSQIHTEFGMDKDGNIIFQDDNKGTYTAQIYNKLVNEFISQLRSAGITTSQISDADAKKIVQTAWIMTYNDFNSSKKNDTVQFLNKTLENMRKILNKIQTNPEYLDIIKGHTAYADSYLTGGLTHYGTPTTYNGTNKYDEVIDLKGGYKPTSDGVVHLNNTIDDPDYQTTMGQLLQRLIDKYSNIDSNIITSVFREAQKKAINIARNNTRDVPRGANGGTDKATGIDDSEGWNGADYANGKIHMDKLVNLTLYCFDKLLYQKLFS